MINSGLKFFLLAVIRMVRHEGYNSNGFGRAPDVLSSESIGICEPGDDLV